jgi:hypothetical protein
MESKPRERSMRRICRLDGYGSGVSAGVPYLPSELCRALIWNTYVGSSGCGSGAILIKLPWTSGLASGQQ